MCPAQPFCETDFQRVLPFYDLQTQVERVVFLGDREGFSGASLWRIEAAGGLFALRAVPADQIDQDRELGLHALLAHIHHRGVRQVPVPIAARNGSTLVSGCGGVWQLEPWMPGSAERGMPNEQRLQAAMRSLAAWHRAAASFEPNKIQATWFFQAASRPSPGIEDRIKLIAHWDAATCERVRIHLNSIAWPEFQQTGLRILQCFLQAAPVIVNELRLVREVRVPLQPCLRDVWSDHVLFTGDEVTGLIDAHACRSDNVATDVARLLGSFVGDDSAAREFAIDAYQRTRPLTTDESVLLELFDRSSVLLSGMTWLDWVCLRGRQFGQREKVTARLKSIRERLEHLVRRI